jgi:hypothetical protein
MGVVGAGGLGMLTGFAMLAANVFWTKTGRDRFLNANAFFERLGLVAGLVFGSVPSLRPRRMIVHWPTLANGGDP